MLSTKSIALLGGLSLILLGADKAKSPTLERADQTYKSSVAKAQAEFDRTKGKAVDVRLKAYRDALAAATRAGDFDSAAALKIAISEFESGEGSTAKRPRPNGIVKFEDHEYAIIREDATWHVAKRICEEMGGHLATINSPQEEKFLLKFGAEAQVECWVGATDEVEEGKWVWVDGSIADAKKFDLDNYFEAEHGLYCGKDQRLHDMYCGKR